MDTLFDPLEYSKKCVREFVEERLEVAIIYSTIDINRLVEITCHSKTYLEMNFICTEEAQALECSPTTKRLWQYPEISDCWREYCKKNKPNHGG